MSDPNQTSEHVRPADVEPTGAYVPGGTDARVVALLDQYLADLQVGKAPDKAKLLADHPDLAGSLEQCLSGIDFVHRAAQAQADMPARLGDFKIIREVGRGGMGVVYEAEQISLKRKVALKVLRFGAVADGDVMKRFQREAETVALLHHTNIVPIHAVGCEAGVNYYAMQFIEGKSLADTKTACGVAGDFQRIANWTLQAAEALAHAHQRGVIHRDIKPSNLILDLEGTVWLTDFGLAKRADEVTLTAAGVLMGTPRYMSPEQAASARQPIDHRTDIYSLGATLYELATSKPVFDAQTPQGVITQILNSEPIAPRFISRQMPRDLETIILKCLAKEPDKRYQQAKDLADDLGSFLENRPIKARRIGLLERGVRWVKKRRGSAAVAAGAAAVAAVLLITGYLAWTYYAESQLGQLVLTTEGPALVAEILGEDGEPIMASLPVPTVRPVSLPAGPHRLRLSGPGQLSETWDIDIEKGQKLDVPVKMIDRAMGPSLEIRGPDAPMIVQLNEQNHILHRTDRGWRLVNMATMLPVWVNDLKYPENPATPWLPMGDPADLLQVTEWSHHYANGSAPGLAQPSIDLDGDGKDDLIFASRVSPSLIAVSGRDGKVLWWYRAAPEIPKGLDVNKDPLDTKQSRDNAGAVMQPVLASVDGEPLAVTVFGSSTTGTTFFRTQSNKTYQGGPVFYVDAVNARTGKRLWRRILDLSDLKFMSPEMAKQCFPPRPDIVELDGKPVVVLGIGAKMFGFDLKTGQDAWPVFNLGAELMMPLRIGKLSADGEPTAIAILPMTRVRAISLSSREVLWERSFIVPSQGGRIAPNLSDYPLVWFANLERDGNVQVIVPLASDHTRATNRDFGIEVLDGKTGATRWQRTLRRFRSGNFMSTTLDAPLRVVVGPDLDGDGHNEVFVASFGVSQDPGNFELKSFLQIDALSGKDGSVFWRNRRAIASTARTFSISRPIQWWQPGADGWPQLVVPVDRGAGGQAITYVFSASTGQVTHVLPEASVVDVADLNNDGMPDLYYLAWTKGPRLLTALKGLPPLKWRRPGRIDPSADFDGDGVTDFIKFGITTANREAISGRDGHSLWHVKSSMFWGPTLALDVDGDGVPDLLGLEQAPMPSPYANQFLAAYSGKDGHLLWREPIAEMQQGTSSTFGAGPRGDFQYPLLDYVDFDGDGRPEILVVSSFGKFGLNLAALSSHDGKLLWKVPILPAAFIGRSPLDRHLFHDLDGDGVRDLVLWTPETVDANGNPKGAILRAISGRNGKTLWTAELPSRTYLYPRVAVADLQGEGKPQVVLTTRTTPGNLDNCELIVLDGKTGKMNWRWPSVTNETWHDYCPPLLVDQMGDGKRVIVLGVYKWVNGHDSRIHVVDAKGKLLRNDVPNFNPRQARVWTACDLDGSGKESLIHSTNTGVQAFDLGENKVRWTWDTAALNISSDNIRLDTPLRPDELTLYTWTTAFGLNAKTGTARWRCDMPTSHPFRGPQIVLASKSGELPMVLSQELNLPILALQKAAPTDPVGRYELSKLARSEIVPAEHIDYRPLPCSRFRYRGALINFVYGPLPLCGVLIYWCARRRWRRALFIAIFTLVLSAVIAMPAVDNVVIGDEPPLEPDERYSPEGWYWALPVSATLVFTVIFWWTLAYWFFRGVWKLAKLLRSRIRG